jgi:diketogulonate reductase-like aldo/keto reductase
MSSKKQTAVEWLIEQILPTISETLNDVCIKELIEIAKALEKEQMDKVSEDWFVEGCSHMKENKRIYQSFEQYYNETYGN